MCLAWHRRGLVVPLVAALAFSGRLCAQPTQPNVVVILTDDAGYSDLGFAAALTGQTFRGMTPHLDALAQQSVVFRQGYAAPVCTPTRVGLLTGLYQQRQGVERVLGNDLGQTAGLSGDAVTMAHHLRSLGYATGAIGKWHLGYVAGVNRPNDMGFDEFYGFLSGSRQYFADVSPSNVMLRNTTNVESQWRAEGDVGLYDPVGGRYVTDALGEEAAAFIDRQAAASTPFFLYVALSAPHSPYTAKQQDYDLFPDLDGPQRKTTAMVHAADRAVGMITSALATHGIEDNTVIVFLNDNGGTSDHFNQPWRDFKASVFEGGVRVPYMIKLPGLSPGVYEAPVTLYDMAPTIVAAAGGSLDSHQTDGVDLLPYLTGANPSQPHDVVYFRNNEVWAIRRGDWKLGRMSTTSTRALFNLATHPAENFNQLALQPEIAETLAREFTRWEATMAKPKFGALGTMDRNLFDHFVLPGDAQEAVNWSQHGVWRPVGVPSTPVRLNPDDGYANAVLEFTVKQGGDYV
ncbi:MAG TPA: sulfatase-like hydrolase/transferase, partial [Lacipirellulaceae bacterium]|nr:sulfatase-like hydrolase/transferase [Lacipirellulaceae bacterium]